MDSVVPGVDPRLGSGGLTGFVFSLEVSDDLSGVPTTQRLRSVLGRLHSGDCVLLSTPSNFDDGVGVDTGDGEHVWGFGVPREDGGYPEQNNKESCGRRTEEHGTDTPTHDQ